MIWSLGNASRSTTSTLYPLRANSIATGEPAHRAPTTIASYITDTSRYVRINPTRGKDAPHGGSDCSGEEIAADRCWEASAAWTLPAPRAILGETHVGNCGRSARHNGNRYS